MTEQNEYYIDDLVTKVEKTPEPEQKVPEEKLEPVAKARPDQPQKGHSAFAFSRG